VPLSKLSEQAEKMEALLRSVQTEWVKCQEKINLKFLELQTEGIKCQELQTEWLKCQENINNKLQALQAEIVKNKVKKDYESQMLQTDLFNKCVEKMDSKFQNMDIKFQTLQTELIKLQNNQKDHANKIQEENYAKNIEMRAVNEQKLSDLKQQKEVQSIKSPYFSGKRDENVEEWISYWESKFKPLERPNSEWAVELGKCLKDLPLEWYLYYCYIAYGKAERNALDFNMPTENFKNLFTYDSILWPTFCYDCICLFKHPSDWRQELNSYCVQTRLADTDVIRIVVILLFAFERQRAVDILNASNKEEHKFDVDNLNSMLFDRGGGYGYRYISICHRHTISSVLKEGRKTNWTWDKTVEG
jgi:hypothetical protein